MKASSLRRKHVQLDQRKLNRAVRILGAKTEAEALDRALSVVVDEDKIDAALRKTRGKGRILKVFRQHAAGCHRHQYLHRLAERRPA